jgi:AcrR family transcriptional regulator
MRDLGQTRSGLGAARRASPSQLRSNGTRREQLLNAAVRVILERGAGNLTLEAVCEVAHVSKGGLLYYFDGKAALLSALVDYLAERLESFSDQASSCAAVSGLDAARAYLHTVASMGELSPDQQLRKALAFICVAYPETVQEIRSRLSRRPRRRAGREMSLKELQLRLLADGLWLADICGYHPVASEHRLELLKLCGSDELSLDELPAR